MSSTHDITLLTAKTVGIFAAGWLSAIAGTNNIRIKPLYSPGGLDSAGPGSEDLQLTTAQRLAVWHTQYNNGGATVVPLNVLGTGALATAGALLPSTSSSSWIPAVGDKMWFYTAAATVFSVLPYTFLVMMPGIKKLQQLRLSKSLNTTSEDAVAADRGIQAWNAQHQVRAVLWSSAFIMAIVGSIH